MYSKSIKELKGIGDKTAALYEKLGITTIGQLLEYYPHGYENYEPAVTVRDAPRGELCAVRVRLRGAISQRQGKKAMVFSCVVGDTTGSIKVLFFNMPFIRNIFKPGMDYILRGVITEETMSQPSLYTLMDYEKLLVSLSPRYSLTKGLTHKGVGKAVKTALSGIKNWEVLPDGLSEKYGLLSHADAVRLIHFPEKNEDVLKAQRTLSFEEFFFFIHMMKGGRSDKEVRTSPFCMEKKDGIDIFINSLPYELTGAQKNAVNEIIKDLTGGGVMNRLVQGDVGSGKTIISFIALLLCVLNGYQGALMAPTEVLAVQHFENIKSMSEKYGLPFVPVLLTGGLKASERKKAYGLIASGEGNVIIGTHALIQEKVDYKELALVITDEQHRFGVKQREVFSQKGRDVHVLVMSATPIPRTLALILYGDLSISIVNEYPASRLPIKNALMGPEARTKAWRFIFKELEKGHQAYIICPMVEEGEMDGLENVTDYTKKIKSAFPDNIRIAMLHGKMKSDEKTRIMEDFSSHKTDILVSTTVIEVGIDVPNATVILIENSERFGLSQLHQLRGRTGRGSDQSYCIFLTGSEKALKAERLDVISHTNDGFKIAEEDLRLRGPGDLTGIRQSGSLSFKVADICRDGDVLKEAARAVDECIDMGLKVEYPAYFDIENAVL